MAETLTEVEWDGSWSGILNSPEFDLLTPDQQKGAFGRYKQDFISQVGPDLGALDASTYRRWFDQMDSVEAGFRQLDAMVSEDYSAERAYAERKDLIAGSSFELSYGGEKMLDEEGNIKRGNPPEVEKGQRLTTLEKLKSLKWRDRTNHLIRRGVTPGEHLGVEHGRYTFGVQKPEAPKTFPERIQGEKFFANEIQKFKAYSDEELAQAPYVLVDPNEPVVRITPSEAQKAWLEENSISNNAQSYYWETYRNEDTGELMFNPGQVLRGPEKFYNLVKDAYTEEDAESVVTAATNFPVYWGHLQRRMTTYLGSKTFDDVYQSGLGGEFGIDTFNAKFRASGGDDEIAEGEPGYELFLSKRRLRRISDADGLNDPDFGKDKLEDLRRFFLPKIGMQESSPGELVNDEDLRLLYWHSVAATEDAWNAKTVGARDPKGNFTVNPKALQTWKLKDLETALGSVKDGEGDYLPAEEIKEIMETAWLFQEQAATSLMSALLLGGSDTPRYPGRNPYTDKSSGAEPEEIKWDETGIVKGAPATLLKGGLGKLEASLRPVAEKIHSANAALLRMFLKEYHANVEKGTREPRTDKELLALYAKGIQDPSLVEEMGTLKNMYLGGRGVSMSSFGMFLQTLKNSEQDSWSDEPLGNLAQTIGRFLVGFEDGAVKGVPEFIWGLVGAIQSMGSDGDPILIQATQHLSRLGAEVDAAELYGASTKYGKIFGREAIFLASAAPTAGWSLMARGLTMYIPRAVGVLGRRAVGKFAPGAAEKVAAWEISREMRGAALKGGAALFGESKLPLLGLHWFVRKGGAGSVDQFGRTLLQRFATKGARRGYFGVQASRSGEAMYREAYNAHREKFLLQGFTPEEASDKAVSKSWGPALGASLVTGALMYIIPGGTERIFEKGLGQMTWKQLLSTAGLKSRELTTALGKKELREAGKLFLQGTMAGKGWIVHGGAEYVEEFIDEFIQGVISSVTWNPDMTLDHILEGAFEAAWVGFVMGASVSGAMQAQGVSSNNYHLGKDGKMYWAGKPKERGGAPTLEVLSEEYQTAWSNVQNIADRLRPTGNTETTVALDEVVQAFEDNKDSATRVESLDRESPKPQDNNEVWWMAEGAKIVHGHFLVVPDSVTGKTGEFVQAFPTEENPNPAPRSAAEVSGITTRESDLVVPADEQAAMEIIVSLKAQFHAVENDGALSTAERKVKLQEVYEEGRKKLSNNANAQLVWDLHRAGYDRRMQLAQRGSSAAIDERLGTPVGADPSKAVLAWTSQPESNVEDGPRTRKEFLNLFTQVYTEESVPGLAELFRGNPLEGGVALTALDLAFGAISVMEQVMGRAAPTARVGEAPLSEDAKELTKTANTLKNRIGNAIKAFNKRIDKLLAVKDLTGAEAAKQTGQVQLAVADFYRKIAGARGVFKQFGLNLEGSGGFKESYEQYVEENPFETSTEPVIARLDAFLHTATRNDDGLLTSAHVSLPRIDWSLGTEDNIDKGVRYIHNLVARTGLPYGQYNSDVRISMDSPTAMAAAESLRQLQEELDSGTEGIESVELYSAKEQKRVKIVSRKAFKADLRSAVKVRRETDPTATLPSEELQDTVYTYFLNERELTLEENIFEDDDVEDDEEGGTPPEVVEPVTKENLGVRARDFSAEALPDDFPLFHEFYAELIAGEPVATDETITPDRLFNAWQRGLIAALNKLTTGISDEFQQKREGLSEESDADLLERINADEDAQLSPWEEIKKSVVETDRAGAFKEAERAGMKVTSAPKPSPGAGPQDTGASPATTAEELDAAAKQAQDDAAAAAKAAKAAQEEAKKSQVKKEDIKKAEDRRTKAAQAYGKAQEDLYVAEENQEHTSADQFAELESAVEAAQTELTAADTAWSDLLNKGRSTRKKAQGAAQTAEQAQQKAAATTQAAEKGPEVVPTVQSDTEETKAAARREFRREAVENATPGDSLEDVFEFQVEDEEMGDVEDVAFDAPATIVRDVADSVYYDPAFANKDEVTKLNEFEARFKEVEENATNTIGKMDEADDFFTEMESVKDLIRGISSVEELSRFNKDVSFADTVMAEQKADVDPEQVSTDEGSKEPKVDPDLKKAGTTDEDRYARGEEIKEFLDGLRKVRVVRRGPEAGVPVDSVTFTKEGLTDSNGKLVIRDVKVKHEKDGLLAINEEIFELFPLDLENVKQFNKLPHPFTGVRSKLGDVHLVEGKNITKETKAQRKAGKPPVAVSPSFVGSKYALAIRKVPSAIQWVGRLDFAFTNSPMHVAAQLTHEYYAAKKEGRDYEGFQLPKKYVDNPKLLNPAIKVENGMVVGATVPFRVGINSGKLETVYVGSKKAVRTLADINHITISEAARGHSKRTQSVPRNREFSAVLDDIDTLGDAHGLSEEELEFITSGDPALRGLSLNEILDAQLKKFAGVTKLPAEARAQILGGLASRVYLSILKTRLANLSSDTTELGMETGKSEAVVLNAESLRKAFDALYKPDNTGFTAVGGIGKHLWELVAVRMTNGRGVEELFADTEKFIKEEDKHKRKYQYISDENETPIGSFFIAQEIQAFANNSGKTVGSYTPQEADSLSVAPEAVQDALVAKGKAIEDNQYTGLDTTTESVMVEAEDESTDAADMADSGVESAQDEGASGSIPAASESEMTRERLLAQAGATKQLSGGQVSDVRSAQEEAFEMAASEGRVRIRKDMATLGIPVNGQWSTEDARSALEVIARGGHTPVVPRAEVHMDSTSINVRREAEMKIAQQILKVWDNMDMDTIQFWSSNIQSAGTYDTSSIPGQPHTLVLSNITTNTYGVANTLLHELRHHILNHIIDNPVTPAEVEFVEALTLYRARLQTYYQQLLRRRGKTYDLSQRHAETVSTNASPRRIRKALVRSNSVNAKRYDKEWARTADLRYTDESEWVTNDKGEVFAESKQTEELNLARASYQRVLEEKFGVMGDNDALAEVAYVLGVGSQEGAYSENYHLKELAVAIQNSPFFRDFIKDVDADLAGGSIFTKFMRAAWYSRTGAAPDSASVIMEGMINDIHEDALAIDPSRYGVLVSRLGSPKSEASQVNDYRENTPAVSASLPRANAEYVKTAVPAKWDHPTLGLKSRTHLGAAAWMLPNGRLLGAGLIKESGEFPTGARESHEAIVRQAFPNAPEFLDESGLNVSTAEAFALKSGWVRILIERDGLTNKKLMHYAAATPLGGLSLNQRAVIKDWAAMHGVDLKDGVKYDAEPLREALLDLADAKRAGRLEDASMSLPTHRFESQQEATFWEGYQKEQAAFKKLRKAFLQMGITIVPDEVETPQVSDSVNDVVLVPSKTTPEYADLAREGFRSSFKSLFTTADRKFALYEMGQISSETTGFVASALDDAGSYEKLMANMVTQAALGDVSPTKLGPIDLQTFSNQILAGAYGEGARNQLQTMMDVADTAIGLRFDEVAITNGLPNWDKNHNGIRELGLSILPETIPDLKKLASEQDITITELLEELDVDNDFKDQVKASLAYQEQKAASFDGVGAAHQLSITRKDRTSRSQARNAMRDQAVGKAVIAHEQVSATHLVSKLGLPEVELKKLIGEVDRWAYDDITGVRAAMELHKRYMDEGLTEIEADEAVSLLTDKISKFPNKQLSDEADYNLSLILRDPKLLEVTDVASFKKYVKANYGNRAWGPVVLKLIKAIESNTHQHDTSLGLQWEVGSEGPHYNLKYNNLNLNLAASPRTTLHELIHAGTSKWVFSHEYRIQQELEEMGMGHNAYGDVLDRLLEDKETPTLMKDVVRVYRSAVEQAGLSKNLESGKTQETFPGISPSLDGLFTDEQIGRAYPSVFGNAFSPEGSPDTHKYTAAAHNHNQNEWGLKQRSLRATEKGISTGHPQLDHDVTRRVYGFTSMGEFLSESWASDPFAKRLADMAPVEGLESTPTEEATNLLQQLQGLIRKLFKSLGLDLSKKSNKTLLDQVQSLSAQIMTREDHVNLDELISENPVKLSQRTAEGYSAVESTEFDQSLRDPRLDKPESAAVKKLRESIDKGPETSKSLAADTEYMAAVESGATRDKKTGKAIWKNKKLKDAAERAHVASAESMGFNVVGWHANREGGEFTVFDDEKLGDTHGSINSELGHFFASNRDTAQTYNDLTFFKGFESAGAQSGLFDSVKALVRALELSPKLNEKVPGAQMIDQAAAGDLAFTEDMESSQIERMYTLSGAVKNLKGLKDGIRAAIQRKNVISFFEQLRDLIYTGRHYAGVQSWAGSRLVRRALASYDLMNPESSIVTVPSKDGSVRPFFLKAGEGLKSPYLLSKKTLHAPQRWHREVSQKMREGETQRTAFVSEDPIYDVGIAGVKQMDIDSMLALSKRTKDEKGAELHKVEKSHIWIIPDASNVRSAELVVWDDAGKVIPPSQRFAPGKRDIHGISRSLPASGLTPYANVFNTPRLMSNTSYAWRSMGAKEFKQLVAGEKEYLGDKAATKGNWLAGVPESASQYAAKGKILVEFGGVTIQGDEGLSPGSVAGVGNITNVWVYDERKEDWVQQPKLNPNFEPQTNVGWLGAKGVPQGQGGPGIAAPNLVKDAQGGVLDLSTIKKTREYLRDNGFFDTSIQKKVYFPLGLVKKVTDAWNSAGILTHINTGELNVRAVQKALADFGQELAKGAEKTNWTKTEVTYLMQPFAEAMLGHGGRGETSMSIPTLSAIKEKFIRTRKRDLGTTETASRTGAQQDALGVATFVRNPSSAFLGGVAGGIVGLTTGYPVAGSVIGAMLGKAIPDKFLFPRARKTYIPPMIRALKRVGPNLERLGAMMTVEGQMGPTGQRVLMELRGEIYKHSLLAASHMKEIRFRMQSNAAIRTEFVEDLEDPDYEYYNPDLAAAINYMLGSANDEDVLDLMFPATVAGGLSERQEYEKIKREALSLISSQQTTAMNAAKKMMEEGADRPESERWYRDEMSSIAKQREGVMRVFHDGMTDLYSRASDEFTNRQKDAGKLVRALDPKLATALQDSRQALNDLQYELIQYPEMLQSYTGSDLEFLQNLTTKLGSSLGIWLTRSYDSLDRQGWLEFLEHSGSAKAKKAWETGYNFFANELLSFEAERIMQAYPDLSPVTAKIMAERYSKPTKGEIESRMKEWLVAWRKERTAGMRTGLMNLKALQPRADIPKELRGLVGQHQDNIFNMSRSLVTLGSMMANHKFLISIKDTLETAEKVSRDKVKATGKGVPLVLLTQDKRIAADNGLVPFVDENERIRVGGEHYGPLAKMYGPKHMVEALRDIQPGEMNAMQQTLGHVASWTMGNMTTRRLRTHVRNFIGNPIFLMNAGMPIRAFAHLGGMPISAFRQAFGPNYTVPPGSPATAFAAAGNNKVIRAVSGKLRQWTKYTEGKDSGATTFGEESRRFMGEHSRLGLTGSDVHVSHQKELRESLKDPTSGMRETWGDIPQGATQLLSDANTWLTEMYQAGDDYWKISAYEGQLEKLSRAFGLLEELPVIGRLSNLVGSPVKLRNQIEEKVAGRDRLKGDSLAIKRIIDEYGDKATPEVKHLQVKYGDRVFALELLKRAAARNVHVTMPNYGNALEGIRLMKRKGWTSLIAPFISFTAEVYRIRLATPMLAAEEMKSKVPGIKAMGAARMLHTVLNYAGSRYALKGAAGLMVQLAEALDDDDDEDKMLPGQGDAGFTHEEALKRILGKFYKDGVVAVLGKDGNDITWVDLTYMYSFSQFDNATQLMIPKKAYEGTAAMLNSLLPAKVINTLGLDSVGTPTSETDMKRFQRGLSSLAVPFFSGQLYIDAVQKAQSRQMDSLLQLDQTSVGTQISSIAAAYRDIFLPGTVVDLLKVGKAVVAGGETYENGRRITPLQEFLAQLSGTKINTTDVDWAFTKLYNYRAKQRMDAELSFTKLLKGRTTVTEKLYRERYQYMQDIMGQLAKELHYDYMSESMLMGRTKARLHLEEHKGLSPELKEQARLGSYLPWVPSDRDLEAMDRESLVIGEGGTRRDLTEELINETLNYGRLTIQDGPLDADELDIEAVLERLRRMR